MSVLQAKKDKLNGDRSEEEVFLDPESSDLSVSFADMVEQTRVACDA